nr:uncharacterized protein LOC129284041 [Lytechinus pictus]
MLGTLTEDKKSNWKTYVAPLVHAYNCTKHSVTGFSPFYLMYGRHPRLPIDIFLGLDAQGEDIASAPDYVTKLRDRLDYAYKVASERNDQAGAKNKGRYDQKLKENKIEVGDRVLVKIKGVKGKNKLGDIWGKDPHIVVEQPNEDIPVFRVRPDGTRGKTRVLHRNLLLPCNFLPKIDSHSNHKSVAKNKVTPPTNPDIRQESEINEEEESVTAWNVPVDRQENSDNDFGVNLSQSFPQNNDSTLGQTNPNPDAEIESLVDSESIEAPVNVDPSPVPSDDEQETASVEEEDCPPRRSQRCSRPPDRLTYNQSQIVQLIVGVTPE